MATSYEVSVGALIAKWPEQGGDIELVSLRCRQAFGGGACRLQLAPPQGNAPEPGDPVQVTLGDGESASLVFTGEVDEVGADAERWRITAHNGLPKLAALDLSQAWTEATADEVLRELLEEAGLEAGEICAGPSLRVFRSLRGVRGERLAARLLKRMGAEMFVDGEGKVQVLSVDAPGRERSFTWGEDLLEMRLRRVAPPLGEARVFARGLDGPTLLADASRQVGEASGDPGASHSWVDGAVADSAAAEAVAAAAVKRAAARPMLGHVSLLGAPAIQPGDSLTILKLPTEHALSEVLADQPLRARAVEHRFDVAGGMRTKVSV